jgi:hypothetical protein
MDKFEIWSNGSWIEVSEYIFRSWCSKRKLNNKSYIGQRYMLGTNEPIGKNQATED